MINNLHLLSVVVPVFKTEKYLDACINSILDQTYPNLEIILVNDGSPDSSPEICNRYATLYTNISVIHKENGGLASARNAGIQAARGEYITFIDSDDAYGDVNTLAACINCFQKNHDLDIVQFPVNFINEDGSIIPKKLSNQRQVYSTNKAFTEQLSCWLLHLSSNLTSAVCDKVFRKTCFSSVLFTDIFCEDALLLIELIKFSPKILVQTEGLYLYIQHEGSAMNSNQTLKKYSGYYHVFAELYKNLVEYSDNYEKHSTCLIKICDLLRAIHCYYGKIAFEQLATSVPGMPLNHISGNLRQRIILIAISLFGLKNFVRLSMFYTYLRTDLKHTLRILKIKP